VLGLDTEQVQHGMHGREAFSNLLLLEGGSEELAQLADPEGG
jgi:hypothetical protein